VSSSPDYLIVGSGIAALRAALALAESGQVLLLTKAASAEGNTGYAQGGIAAAVGDDDTPRLHEKDTLAAGDGLCDVHAVRILVEQGPADVHELMDWGAAFDRQANGEVALAREAAHSVRRVLHARDTTGRTIGGTLWARTAAHPRIEALEHARATAILIEDGRAVGVEYLDPDGTRRTARARATLLATGGAGQVFRETTNPEVASGDGIAMAWAAGARVADLEFVQFHPTALQVEGRPRFLLSEALRGEGARLVNADGEPFMTRYEPAGDLAPRDRVSRGLVRELARTGRPVFLSLQHLDPTMVHARFPHIAEACRAAGLDLARDPVPVSPAAHYVMGGVETDLDGRTSIRGLFAAGEVASTGVHGANRLASNSLLECAVLGRTCAAHIVGMPPAAAPALPDWDESQVEDADEQVVISHNWDELRLLMWNYVGIVRTTRRLERALNRIALLREEIHDYYASFRVTRDLLELRNLVECAELVVRSGLMRRESRGLHCSRDFPDALPVSFPTVLSRPAQAGTRHLRSRAEKG